MTLHPTLLVYVSTVVPALKPVKVVPVITPTAVLDEIQGKAVAAVALPVKAIVPFKQTVLVLEIVG